MRGAKRRAASAHAEEEAIARADDQESIRPRTSPLNIPPRVLRSRAAIEQFVLKARNVAASLLPQRASQLMPHHAPARGRAGRRGRAPSRGKLCS